MFAASLKLQEIAGWSQVYLLLAPATLGR